MKEIISKDGTRITYSKTGQGPAVLLVDGAMCNSSFGPMPKLAPLLSKNFTVITYDRRGRGGSGDTMPYSPQREIEDIEAVINENHGPVFVFGMSSGAILSLMAAATNPQIRKLALYEPPFELDERVNAQNSALHYAKVNELLKLNDRNGTVKYFLGEIVHMPSFAITVMSLLPMWKKMKAIVSSLPYDLQITKSFTLHNLKPQSVSSPTLFIYGSKGDEKLQRAARAASDRIRNSKTRVLEGQGHNVSMKVLAPALVNFFNTKN